MPFTAEHFKRTEGNFFLQHRLIGALRILTANIDPLRVLDYGSGVTPYFGSTLFRTIREDQETVAYEPYLSDKLNNRTHLDRSVSWTDAPPLGLKFDLVVCSFSLHHARKSPAEVIQDLTGCDPKLLVVSDYDFTDSTQKEFEQEFISETEQKELQDSFGGNWARCFAFHSRFGVPDYRSALEGNGFKVRPTAFGVGVARRKFVLIGQAGMQSEAPRFPI